MSMNKTFHVGRIFKNQNLSDSEVKVLEYIFANPEKIKKEGIRQGVLRRPGGVGVA